MMGVGAESASPGWGFSPPSTNTTHHQAGVMLILTTFLPPDLPSAPARPPFLLPAVCRCPALWRMAIA
jgi:hypothetical protein